MSRSVAGPPRRHKRHLEESNQGACTHLTVTRLYDISGSHQCRMCGHYPNIGWVYRCTQDYNGFLPESEFATSETQRWAAQGTDNANDFHVNPWVERAIERGEYTDEQIKVLRAQRLSVTDGISAAKAKVASYSVLCDESSSSNELALFPEIPYRFEHQQAVEKTSMERKIVEQTLKVCDWKCCHKCRPTYRDRAYRSINQIVDDAYTPPPQWELENRRVSDARLVAKLGIPKLPLYLTEDDFQDDESSVSLSGDSLFGESESDIADNKVFHHQNGLRETIGPALNGAIISSGGKSRNIGALEPDSSQESTKRHSRSMMFKRRKSQPTGLERGTKIIQRIQLPEELLQIVAADTPLPDAEEDDEAEDNYGVQDAEEPDGVEDAEEAEEDVDDGGVEVKDGVALTEESVELLVPDIITQA